MPVASRTKFSALFTAAAISLISYPCAFATTFTEIASTNTAVPDGQPGETFGNGIGIRPTVSDGTVVFLGAGTDGTGGLYSGNGGALSVVVDTNTDIPGSSNTFPYVSDNASQSGSNVSFNLGDNSGVYASIDGTISTIANTSTAIPGGYGDFSSFVDSSISGSNVVFSSTGIVNQAGVYSRLNLGALNIVANNGTPVPNGTGTFAGFGQPAIDGTNVVFEAIGASASAAIYSNPTGNGGTINTVVPQNTAIPNGTGNFTGFDRIVASDGNIAFVATGSNSQEGIYSDIDNTLAVVADTSTPVPGGSDDFNPNLFGNVSISGDNVAFTGGGAADGGLYLDEDGTLSKVVAAGDELDGHTVEAVYFFSNGLDGSDLTFTADFGSFQAVFLATVPEPASMTLLAIGALAMLPRRRRDSVNG